MKVDNNRRVQGESTTLADNNLVELPLGWLDDRGQVILYGYLYNLRYNDRYRQPRDRRLI